MNLEKMLKETDCKFTNPVLVAAHKKQQDELAERMGVLALNILREHDEHVKNSVSQIRDLRKSEKLYKEKLDKLTKGLATFNDTGIPFELLDAIGGKRKVQDFCRRNDFDTPDQYR